MFHVTFKPLIIYITLITILKTPTVRSSCEIIIDKESGIIPTFEINIGETLIKKNVISNRFEIGEGVKVTGYCESFFIGSDVQLVNQLSIRQVIELHCNKDSYLLLEGNQIYRPYFGCAKLSWNIFYAHNEQSSWCNNESNATTMFIMSKLDNRYITFAKLCYDFKKNYIRSIDYNIQYSGKPKAEMIKDMEIRRSDTYIEITDDLRLLRAQKSLLITTELLQQNIKDLSKSNLLLSYANYEIRPLIQGNSYAKYFNELNDFFNTIWWYNLRVGNWKLFTDTLENYAQNNTFRLLSGSLGKLKIPYDYLTSQKTEILELKFNSKLVNIPAYISSYVISTDHKNKNFVVFGYNSPYAEFFSLNDIIFCPDICSEIPWLQDVYTSFRYKLGGLIFCCYPDSIKDIMYKY